jgi:effector-binding domain-containing protein
MQYDVVLRTVEAGRIAAVREHVTPVDIAQRFGPALDQVWTFVRAAGLSTNHNVFVYDDSAPGVIEFGVQVDTEFEDGDVVMCSETPAGTIATTTHVGPYDELGAAHSAVRAWCLDEGRPITGPFWEIYGDWNDDPAKLETEVCYLLRP